MENVMSLNEMKLTAKRKHFKGMTPMELGVVMIAIVLLTAAAVWGFSSLSESSKRAVANQEVAALAKAILLYEGDNKTAALPANLGALVTGLTADQSNDGVIKKAYVSKKGWTADSTTFKDPWGNAYVYSTTNRTITCSNNGGTAIVKQF